MIDRRTLIAAGAALAATPAAATQAGSKPKARIKPVIIAHRGASGERPEHTQLAYDLAAQQGADFIEPDLVLTRDGHFVCRHENEIGGTTDVAAHPEFAARRTTKVIDGESLTGWFTEDFTLAELKTLRCRERLPQLRPDNSRFDGQATIPTFEEVIGWRRLWASTHQRQIGLYPELKHPRYFASIGLPMEKRFAALLKKHDLAGKTAPLYVQCFEVGPLKTLSRLIKAPLIQLIAEEGGPADLPELTYGEMTGERGLKQMAAYAAGVGPQWTYVVPDDDRVRSPVDFVREAHAAGLRVHPWTVRRENYFLPKDLKMLPAADRPDQERLRGDVEGLFEALFNAGVDGVFTDNPREGVAARDAFMR